MVWENQTLQRIQNNCKMLYNGYDEKVEYAIDVAYHQTGCPHYGITTKVKDDCECPTVKEQRARKIKRPGYLDQLAQFSQNKDTDRNPKAERGAPRVKVAGRPPGDMTGFFALDELTCEIIATIDKAIEEVGRDRSWACGPVHQVLAGLSHQVAYFVESRPDVARDIEIATGKWIDSARSTLKISTEQAIFDSVTCGNCGGALGTPWGNRGETDVRCIGSPDSGPCGESYPVSEWLRLYETSRAAA